MTCVSGKPFKTASGECLSGFHKAAPGGQRERAPNADPAHSKLRQLGDCRPNRPADRNVHGLWRYCLNDGGKVLASPQPWRIKTIRACPGIGCQTPDRFV